MTRWQFSGPRGDLLDSRLCLYKNGLGPERLKRIAPQIPTWLDFIFFEGSGTAASRPETALAVIEVKNHFRSRAKVIVW